MENRVKLLELQQKILEEKVKLLELQQKLLEEKVKMLEEESQAAQGLVLLREASWKDIPEGNRKHGRVASW